MDKIKIQEALVVEGKYDKNTLAQIIDAPIFVTDGFGIFKDPEKLALLRMVAERRGLIVLTDSDGAGLVIRNHLKGTIPPERVKHAYIPDVFGKERRKAAPGKEGKLGVEGMTPEVLIAALRNAGATVLEEPAVGASIARPLPDDPPLRTSDACPYESEGDPITKTDLFDLGLTGRPDSRKNRKVLQKALALPENLSANALLTALNCIMTREELAGFLASANAL
jgi:ribonuclease M5